MAERQHTQARGRARRQALITATQDLLKQQSLDQISLAMVAEEAGIPVSSAYHFYPDINDLFKDAARTIAIEMIDKIASLPDAPRAEEWQTIVRSFLNGACETFNADAAARELMLGVRTPPDIKRAACFEESRFGHALLELIAREFLLPPIENAEEVFFRGIQICDLMFSLSVAEKGYVTQSWREEGCIASIAYLGVYLPTRLPRRPSAPVVVRPPVLAEIGGRQPKKRNAAAKLGPAE